MTTVINPDNDKVIQTYKQYFDILCLSSREGSEMEKKALAASLTQSHFMDHIACEMKDLKKLLREDLLPSDHLEE